MKKEKRTDLKSFTALKKSLSDDGLKNFCKRIAKQYADSDGSFSSTYFTEAEGISDSCFYKVLEEAVIKNLVSDKIVDKMEAKAISNQQRHHEEAGSRSIVHYGLLRKKRREYIISNFSFEDKVSIAKYVTLEIDKSLGEIAHEYGILEQDLKLILKEVFLNPDTDEEICVRLEERSVLREKMRIESEFEKPWSERKSQEETP